MTAPKALTLTPIELLFSQGFGTRRVCAGRLAAGHLRVAGQVIEDPRARLDLPDGVFEVEGVPWTYQARALVMMNKPAGYECSQRPGAWPSVLSLLPTPLRVRGLQSVGRLDQDTTGLLLLTDDGALLHRLTSPKHHVPKVYDAAVKHPLTEQDIQNLLDGVDLHEDGVLRALAAERLDPLRLRLTLTEGKYHQVKRMVAALGNRVEALHRHAIGDLVLPPSLAPGEWAWLQPEAVTG